MLHGLLLFATAFLSVFLFGMQSQWVRDKHTYTAFVCSLLIGSSQLVFFKFVPDASFWQCVFWVLGGAFGIVSSIYAHNVWLLYFPNGGGK